METSNRNLVWHESESSEELRRSVFGHGGATIWLTGLSGSGKSTIAYRLEKELLLRGCHATVLDGDNVRHGLNQDLGFSESHRRENIRRIGEVALLFAEAGLITIASFVSPEKASRDAVRKRFSSSQSTVPFFEVWVSTPLEVCEDRDPKDLYRKARAGEIKNFTGISAPYEAPLQPDLELPAHKESLGECIQRIFALLEQTRVLGDSNAEAKG